MHFLKKGIFTFGQIFILSAGAYALCRDYADRGIYDA